MKDIAYPLIISVNIWLGLWTLIGAVNALHIALASLLVVYALINRESLSSPNA